VRGGGCERARSDRTSGDGGLPSGVGTVVGARSRGCRGEYPVGDLAHCAGPAGMGEDDAGGSENGRV
jgi:hypothetical protein